MNEPDDTFVRLEKRLSNLLLGSSRRYGTGRWAAARRVRHHLLNAIRHLGGIAFEGFFLIGAAGIRDVISCIMTSGKPCKNKRGQGNEAYVLLHVHPHVVKARKGIIAFPGYRMRQRKRRATCSKLLPCTVPHVQFGMIVRIRIGRVGNQRLHMTVAERKVRMVAVMCRYCAVTPVRVG